MSDVKQKSLKSMKNSVNEILDAFFDEYRDENALKLLAFPYAEMMNNDLWLFTARKYLYFALNVVDVKITQAFAVEWKKHKAQFFPICAKHMTEFFNKIKNVLTDQDKEQRKLILVEMLTVIDFMPSQFIRVEPDLKIINDIAVRVVK